MSTLYEPLIERDLEAIPDAVTAFLATSGQDDLFVAVARFAYLAFTPSEHGRAAMRSAVAARDLEGLLGNSYAAWLTECARYSAATRAPWSEPPIAERPQFSLQADAGLDAFRTAVRTKDRSAADRWLAANIDSPGFASLFMAAMAGSLSEIGRDLSGGVTAWKLSQHLPEIERYAVLRTAVWDSVTSHDENTAHHALAERDPALVAALVTALVNAGGSVEAFRPLLLLDAGQLATEISGADQAERRVNSFLDRWLGETVSPAQQIRPGSGAKFDPYVLGRDFGQLLQSAALAQRFSLRFPGLDFSPVVTASADNLATASSFEEWSFA